MPSRNSTRTKRASRSKLHPTPAEHKALVEQDRKFRATVPLNLFVEGVVAGTLTNVRDVITLFSLISENLRDIGDNEDAACAFQTINFMLRDALKHAEAQIQANGSAS